MNEEQFKMKCPACGLIFMATKDDIQKTVGTNQYYVPCPREYSVESGKNFSGARKTYCTGYPDYPDCVYTDEDNNN